MPFLSRRSVDPLIPTLAPKDKAFPQRPDLKTPRGRARSEASLLRRVSTLFSVRRRSKASLSLSSASSAGIGSICHTLPRSALHRVSTDSTPQPSLEIRRPSDLGRHASLLESDDSFADSESYGRETQEGRVTGPTGYVSLPNLLGGGFYLPERPSSHLGFQVIPTRRAASNLPLPDLLFRVVLEFLPRNALPAVALASRGFCSAARYALYHSLDVQAVSESSLGKLYNVLACNKELAALVVSFHCRSWPSWELASPDGGVSSLPSDDVCQMFQNMYNLKSLTLSSFVSILSYTSSLTFSLTRLTILDKKITQLQFQTLRSWLATQPSLESLSFPNLVEHTNTDSPLVYEWAPVGDSSQASDHGPPINLLPSLKSLHASTEVVSALCFAMNSPIQHLKLDVHETLYTGLRPGCVVRSLNGVREMHIVFAPDVDKRTVEKFLSITGTVLTGADKVGAMKSLEVEVSWMDDSAAETLYEIVTSVISRFRGLETLKLTLPFRSVQALTSDPISLSLLGPPSLVSPHPRTEPSSDISPSIHTLRGCTIFKGFAACDIEKHYAKTWTKRCPTLSDVQFDFSSSMTDMDVDVELCGVWFRRKVPSSSPLMTTT